jgi:UDP-glucose 4-epimerase
MTSQTWLITGGAGYIGSHIADHFLADEKDIVIYDVAQDGQSSRIDYLRKRHNRGIHYIEGDIRDIAKLEESIFRFKPYGVIHTVALKSVSESMEKPHEYNEVNFEATRNLLKVLTKHQIKNFIFSSTAAVYGSPDHTNPVKESDFPNPISPYGASKLAAEKEVEAFLSLPGNNGTSFRFFNVIGCASPGLKDDSTGNLVPIIIKRLESGLSPVIFGTNYATHDGTCVRDYVDVRDIADAHLKAVNLGIKLPYVLNVGTGQGASVREVIEIISSAVRKSHLKAVFDKARPGDPAFLLADVDLIEKVLGYKSSYSLSESIKSHLKM